MSVFRSSGVLIYTRRWWWMCERVSSRSAFLSISDDLLKISSKCSLCVSMEVFKPLLSNRSLVKPACKCYERTCCSTLWTQGISLQEERASASPYLFRFLMLLFSYLFGFVFFKILSMTCQAEYTVQSAHHLWQAVMTYSFSRYELLISTIQFTR